MDATTAYLVDHALNTDFANLSAHTVHECKRRIIDTFACAVGAYDQPVSRMARALAARVTGTPSATVWGTSAPSTPEAAAFANGVMLRHDDISDNYRVKSGGHPSDTLSGIIAAGEAVHADGAAVINAITIAYDVYCGLIESFDINSRGWDQPVYGVVACALGVGRLLGLTREQLGHAVSLALTPNMALFETRTGEISNWKGCAGGNASRNAVFAAFLARDGFTGPPAVFEGKHGLFSITGRFDWNVSTRADTPHRITLTHMKSYPVCGHGQSAVQCAIELRSRVRVDDIADIQVEAYRMAVELMASEPSRWAPATRETADHSMPYVVAAALLDGEVVPHSFADHKLKDPAMTQMIQKVRVNEAADISARFPESWSTRIRVRHRSGDEAVHEVRYPKGHFNDPLSDRELETKFRGMFRGFGDDMQCQAVLDALWQFDRARDVGEILTALQRKS